MIAGQDKAKGEGLRPVNEDGGKQAAGRGGVTKHPSLPKSFLMLALKVLHPENPQSWGNGEPGRFGNPCRE